MKKWKRQWKIDLIEDMNPTWQDIGVNWGGDNLFFKSKRFPFTRE